MKRVGGEDMEQKMSKIIVVGAGAAGLMAAIQAAIRGIAVLLLEKMPVPGKKILITGKGRCNFTNSCDLSEFTRHFPNNGMFLNSALRAFDNLDLIDFFSSHGVPAKVERGGRVFPESDQARDIVKALVKCAQDAGVLIRTNQSVKSIHLNAGSVAAVVTEGEKFSAEAVILATGGLSYPGTGSTGDGYRMAKELGHTVTPLRPALVPLETREPWVRDLQGLSLKNVEATVKVDGKKVDSEFGELLFTHFGLSGPIILSLSQAVSAMQKKVTPAVVTIEINLKPALTHEMLDKRLQRDFSAFTRKQFKNSLGELLPAKMIPVIVELSEIFPEKPVHQITKEERVRLVELLQNLKLTVSNTRPIAEAVVTSGGVSVKEINPKTMESRLIRGLFFAGEIIDVDGYTGGYNLQAAFSTGYVAGSAAAEWIAAAKK